MENKYIIALEISGTQVKGAIASVAANSLDHLKFPVIEAIAYEDKIDCVQYGRVQNVIDAAQHVNYVLQKLENNPKLAGGKIIGAYVALAGRSLGSVPSNAEHSLHSDMEITKEILNILEREATKTVSGDKKVLELLPRKYIINNQAHSNPIGVMGSKLKGVFTVVTCSPANIRNLEVVFNDRLKLPVHEYIITPLALGDMVLGEEEKQLGCVLVDFGSQTTTVAIYKDRALQYLATLPLGSNNITLDIAKGMNTTEERAELTKCTQGNAMPATAGAPNQENVRLNSYVQARLGEIVANIMAQIGFAGFKPADLVQGFIITGRGAKLTNLPAYLEAQSKMKVRLASIPSIVTIADHSVDPADYASLISIVAKAAKSKNLQNCVELPRDVAEATPVEQQRPLEQYSGGSQYVSYDNDNDADLLDDDEVNAQRAEQRLKDEKRRQEREAQERLRQEEGRRKKEEAHRKKEADQKKKEEQEQQKAQARKNKPSLLEKLRDRVNSMLTYDPNEDDTPLEDE